MAKENVVYHITNDSLLDLPPFNKRLQQSRFYTQDIIFYFNISFSLLNINSSNLTKKNSSYKKIYIDSLLFTLTPQKTIGFPIH